MNKITLPSWPIFRKGMNFWSEKWIMLFLHAFSIDQYFMVLLGFIFPSLGWFPYLKNIACRCCPVGMTNKIEISWFRNVSPSKESMWGVMEIIKYYTDLGRAFLWVQDLEFNTVSVYELYPMSESELDLLPEVQDNLTQGPQAQSWQYSSENTCTVVKTILWWLMSGNLL